MKKLLVVGLSALVLAACGDTEVSEKEVGKVETTESVTNEEEAAPAKEVDTIDVNKEIVNNANMAAKLTKVEKIVDKEWDEELYRVTYEVENKTDKTLTFQANEVSSDGKMIDEGMLTMSQDVAPGKKADAVLEIQNYEGPLPEIKNNLEMILRVYDEDYVVEEDHRVSVDFK
jgi:hypothetical protein